jgi:predicted DsbA family dithiol-disulfide isomerase
VFRRSLLVSEEKRVRVEVWSDIVCPWCYIGKRRLEKAIASFEHADEVQVVWRSFQLDPSHPRGARLPVHEYLARKYGGGSIAHARAMTEQVKAVAAEEGLAYDFDRQSMINTLDAHRVLHLAKAHGLGGEAQERFMRAQHIEGETLDDPETLIRLASEVGVPAEETRRVLSGDAYAKDVEDDIRESRLHGATGVPFFVLNRTYGTAGAQPAEALLSALRKAHDHATAPTP